MKPMNISSGDRPNRKTYQRTNMTTCEILIDKFPSIQTRSIVMIAITLIIMIHFGMKSLSDHLDDLYERRQNLARKQASFSAYADPEGYTEPIDYTFYEPTISTDEESKKPYDYSQTFDDFPGFSFDDLWEWEDEFPPPLMDDTTVYGKPIDYARSTSLETLLVDYVIADEDKVPELPLGEQADQIDVRIASLRLNDVNTPQGQAFQFIVSDDPMQLIAESDHIIQRFVLAVVYYAMNGDQWDHNGWLSEKHECDWYQNVPNSSIGYNARIGVTCDKDKLVQELELGSNNLSGIIPPEIVHLGKLVGLDLSGNRIGGTIPPALGVLASIEFLILSSNNLTGSVPSTMGVGMNKLEALLLQFNELTGKMPESICNLKVDETGLLFNLRADCGKDGTQECHCCDTCCNGFDSCEAVESYEDKN
mmetsp:Transcript_2763/g.3218  ORF Transcript_2763/g.3218 Transcript_2763/m.3218 type:complete len:421 (+) Transcript_2763:53-1315(+)